MKQESDDYYENRAVKLLQEKRASLEWTFTQLTAHLADQGVEIDERVLTNRANRGNFSFKFAMQCLAAMGVTEIKIPSYAAFRRAEQPDGRTTQTINNPVFSWPAVSDEAEE